MEDSMIDMPNMSSFDDKIGNKRVRDGEEEPIGRLEKRPSGITGLNDFQDYSKERVDDQVKNDAFDANVEDKKDDLSLDVNGGKGGGIINAFFSNVFHKNESKNGECDVLNEVEEKSNEVELNVEKLEEKKDSSPELPSKPLDQGNNQKMKPDEYSERVTKTVALKGELRVLDMGDMTMDSYFAKIESMATLLSDLGSPMHDDDLVTHVIHGLSHRFAHVAGIITHCVLFLDLDTVRSMVTTEDLRLKHKTSLTVSLANPSSPTVLLAETNTQPNRDSRPHDSRGPTSTNICRHFGRTGICSLLNYYSPGTTASSSGSTKVQNPGVQNVGNHNGLIVVPEIANQHPNGNSNVVAAQAEGNVTGNNGNQIMCYNYRGLGHFTRNCTVRPRKRDAAYLQTQLLIAQKEEAGIQLQAEEFDLMAAAADLDEIEKVNTNCILMANLQQGSTSGTQTDKALVYDSDGTAEVHNYDNCYDNEIFNMFNQEKQYTELLEPIPEPHQVPQNDNNVIFKVSSVEQSGRTVEQHLANVEETHVLYDSLYNNLAIKVEKVNSVNRKLKETNADLTTKLARYKNQKKCFKISQEKYDKLKRRYQKSVYQVNVLLKR
nr:hybrid signal transduction histidine kinase M [Tanacetum cinerariifolium]